MVSNQGKITTLAADADVDKGLVDGTDKLHSGIIKVLESFAQGDMCIGHAGFTITNDGTYTQYNLAQPIKFYKRGEFVNHTVTLTEAYTSTVQDATHSRYDWVLINPATPELVIVQGTAATTPLVSDITAGYIPIALVHISAGNDDDKFDYSFQTFTMNMVKNSLSIGYDSSGYTEAMSVVATADRTTFKNKVANADIRFILADNTADEKFEILSDDDSDGDEGDTTVFSVDGLGATTVAGTLNLGSVDAAGTDTDKFLVLDSGGNVDYRTGTQVLSDIGGGTSNVAALNDLSDVSYSSGDLTITNLDKVVFANGGNAELSVATTGSGTDGRDLTIAAGSAPTGSADQNGGDLILSSGGGDGTGTSLIRFNTKISGTDAVAERMRIHTDGNVGIGTDSPDAPLHVETSGVGDAVIIESTETGATEAPDLVLYRNSASPAASDEIGSIRFRGKDNAAGDKDYNRITSVIRDTTAASADADLIFQSLSNSVEIEMMKISRIDGIVINEIGASYIDTRIEGDTDANLFFTDASVDRVGIGTNTPTEKLSVSGGVGASAYLGSVTVVTGDPAQPALNLSSSTHRTIIADTQTFSPGPPPSGGALSLVLPAASGTHQGWEMRIIAKNNAGGPDNLTLDVTGSSDLIIDATGATIGNSTAGLTLATGKIYTVIHISSSQYMAIVLN
jgi:hypothetical protein